MHAADWCSVSVFKCLMHDAYRSLGNSRSCSLVGQPFSFEARTCGLVILVCRQCTDSSCYSPGGSRCKAAGLWHENLSLIRLVLAARVNTRRQWTEVRTSSSNQNTRDLAHSPIPHSTPSLYKQHTPLHCRRPSAVMHPSTRFQDDSTCRTCVASLLN